MLKFRLKFLGFSQCESVQFLSSLYIGLSTAGYLVISMHGSLNTINRFKKSLKIPKE
jgi:hypothetical protein